MDGPPAEAGQPGLMGHGVPSPAQWHGSASRRQAEDLPGQGRRPHDADGLEAFLALQHQWREEDMLQQHLDNARVLWNRVVEQNQRDVQEKSEQLKAVGALAAILAGFSLTSFLQFDTTPYKDTTGVMFPLFGVTLAITIGLETVVVILTTVMLASIYKTGQDYVSYAEEAEFMERCHHFAVNYREGDHPPGPQRTFAMHWLQRYEHSWRRAFLLFAAGIPAMFANLVVAAWIKFDGNLPACILTSAVLIASLVMMAYLRKWTAHILAHEQPEQHQPHLAAPGQGLPFDWHLKPSARTYSSARSELPRAHAAGVLAHLNPRCIISGDHSRTTKTPGPDTA